MKKVFFHQINKTILKKIKVYEPGHAVEQAQKTVPNNIIRFNCQRVLWCLERRYVQVSLLKLREKFYFLKKIVNLTLYSMVTSTEMPLGNRTLWFETYCANFSNPPRFGSELGAAHTFQCSGLATSGRIVEVVS